MPNLVGQYQQAAFTSPAFGDSPISSAVVRGNDNSVATVHNTHDADPTIHVQQSTAAARPAFGSAGRIWFTSDTFQLAYDTGAAWESVRIAAAAVAAGSFAAGTYTFPGTLVVTTQLTANGAATFNGNVTFGDAATDTVTFTSRVNSNLIPVDASRNLGDTTRPWASLIVDEPGGVGVRRTSSVILRLGAVDGSVAYVAPEAGSSVAVLFGAGGANRLGARAMNNASGFLWQPTTDDTGLLGNGSFRWNSLRVGTGGAQVDSNFTVSGGVALVTGTGTTTRGGNPYKAVIESPGLSATAYGLAVVDGASATGGAFLGFIDQADTLRGSIIRNTSTTVAYQTSSDGRLKTNITPTAVPALERVLATPVRSYTWVESGESVEIGFIAQELYVTAPEAVSVGGEDARTRPWGVEYGRLTPLLLRAVQELAGRVEELTTRVEILEGIVTP